MWRVANPPNRYLAEHLELEDEAPFAELEIYEEEARSAIAHNRSPDVGFDHSVNPYRGCFHACTYCYARPTHQYLDWGAGTDFDRRIVVKTNIDRLLRRELEKKSWRFETIAFSGVTDCYQPLEAVYGLTRKCLEVCAAYANPVAVITKGKVIRRDIDVLKRLSDGPGCRVYVSIPFADADMARAIEPYASPPGKRFETLKLLSDAGIETGVAIAPVIPGLNESQIPEVLERAQAAGAVHAFHVLLRLPAEVAPVFWSRIEEAFPLRVKKIRSAVQEMRGGKTNESRFGARMQGTGIEITAA